MAKHKTNLRYIFKINSSRLRRSKWNLSLTIPEAIRNEELVSLADNAVLRFINEGKDIDEKANEITKKIKHIKKREFNKENKKEIKKLYADLYNTLFIKEYITVVIDKINDFDRMNSEKGFFINGVKFKRLLATTGGVKKSTVIYVSESVYDMLDKKINNGRNLNKQFIPAKLEAYKSLTCSASIPVSDPKGILVVKDCDTEFLSDVLLLDDTESNYPKLTYEKDYPITLTENDGYGLISPELSQQWSDDIGEKYLPSGFCIRNSFCKGMVFTFDFKDFAEKIANSHMVKDAWGTDRDIRDVQIVLTTSMLKLWDSYDSLDHYLQCCKDNGYTFSITKIIPEKLENQRNLNYQFIQSYEFTDEDIEELVQPTVQEINDVLGNDPIKSILFLKGVHLDEDSYLKHTDSDFIKALMIDKAMIDDPFIRSRIHYAIKKRIKEAKMGVLKVSGNFSVISGDPYSLCQSMFGLKVTGLLKAGEFYNKYWNDKSVDKVVAYRAPMTCHNNIRVLKLKNAEEMNYWYKYMKTVTIFNSWDTTAHALNGADKDGDIILTTDNPVLLRNTKELPAVLCVQKSAEKKVVDEEDLILSNKLGFGDEIGAVTNKITAMIDVASSFDKNSEEYKELQYRIICGQNYQQNSIDKMKGILCKPMPKEWYDYHSAKVTENKDLNLRILADKKPYFFIYNYQGLHNEYKRYIGNCNRNCLMRFGLDVEELIQKENKTEEQAKFLKYYHKKMPVFLNRSTMNRISWKLEDEFNHIKEKCDSVDFDYQILKTNKEYSKSLYDQIKELYSQYKAKTFEYQKISKKKKIDSEDKKIARNVFVNDFKRRAYEICSNSEDLCNILIDLCYNSNSSKQFVWDVCGDVIIDNLLKKNNYTVQYPILDENGSIEYSGERFSLHTKNLNEMEECNIEIDLE